MSQIRVFLAENQVLVLQAIASLLNSQEDFVVTGTACSGVEALAKIGEGTPDILVTDIEMPEMSGLLLANEVRHSMPLLKTVIVTTFSRIGYLRRAQEAGVRGYLLKDSLPEQLFTALRKVHAGHTAIDPQLAVGAWGHPPDPLTDRERRMLWRAAQGQKTSEIARELFLSEGTVRNYLSVVMTKLGASNRVEAARIARTQGWL